MPEMIDVASHFDDIDANDAYTGLYAFTGQFNTHDETAVDGNTEKKRSMSVRPGTVLPARRVISVFDENWIVGDGNTDGLANVAIRSAYWLKKAPETAKLLSPAEALSGANGYELFVSRSFFKDIQNGVTDTDYDAFWEVYASKTENAVVGQFLMTSAGLLRVRGQHKELSGFSLFACDEVGPVEFVTIPPTNTTFDPITETWTGAPVAVPAIVIDGYKMYKYFSQADTKVNAGDVYAVVADQLKVGTTVTINNRGTFKVQQTRPELDAFVTHLVRQ